MPNPRAVHSHLAPLCSIRRPLSTNSWPSFIPVRPRVYQGGCVGRRGTPFAQGIVKSGKWKDESCGGDLRSLLYVTWSEAYLCVKGSPVKGSWHFRKKMTEGLSWRKLLFLCSFLDTLQLTIPQSRLRLDSSLYTREPLGAEICLWLWCCRGRVPDQSL